MKGVEEMSKNKCKCNNGNNAIMPYSGYGGYGAGTSCVAGLNVCTVLPLLIILCKTGLLNNDRAFVLILLFWLCGGINACGSGILGGRGFC